ncbi:MAG: hypothetical protein R3308_04890, partial [Thiohalobacterales bacterium]|nr:hypothetical protein [Thiohalobacterales bacterium]
MNKEHDYSDEQLQAFVDDEIDIIDRAEMMEAIRHNDTLACEVCELLQIKDAVRLAYREPERPAQQKKGLQAGRWSPLPRVAAAAVMLFALGTLTGVLVKPYLANPVSQGTAPLAGLSHAGQELKRVVLHISSAERASLDQALTDAEELLRQYQDRPEMVQLEVVANAEGLSLLRADTSDQAERIRRLAETFDNVSFLACSRTIEKLRMRGIDVHLLPEARVIPGALEAIVDRLQQGWV